MTSQKFFMVLSFLAVSTVDGVPVTETSLYLKSVDQDLTTLTSVPSLESKIKSATETIKVLSQKVEDSLAQSIVVDAAQPTSGITDMPDETLNYAAGSPPVIPAVIASISAQAAVQAPVQDPDSVIREQKFSTVLKDLDELEGLLQGGIRNFTQTRQFAYSTMLRPMLTQVQQLKNNLTNLRNRMIGFVALTELRQQVTDMTTEIGDAITANQVVMPQQKPPALSNVVIDEHEDLKLLQDALGWVSD
jgi:hypothetical protein